MEFKKYQHVERFGTQEVEGIEFGNCYIFPKIDGTNASVWLDNEGCICAGSRTRQLTLEKDNAGFYAFILSDNKYLKFLQKYPKLRLYGEWLVPHSLKTYRINAWRDFYVFDVMEGERYIEYDIYKELVEEFNINYIPPICKIKNGSYEQFINQLSKNIFLIEDGKGNGEGIVIKNYSFVNKFGRITWAKIVTSEFKEKHSKVMGGFEVKGAKMVEEEIVNKFLTTSMIDKVYAKIAIDGWSSKMIPRFLNTCFYDLINEECWNFVKEFKNPTVNFKTLHHFAVAKVKETKKELFA